MPRKTEPTDRIIDAALALASERGWRHTELHDIAARAGVDLATVYRATGGKAGILAAWSRRVDLAMLDGIATPDSTETAHDRLFDILMRRFDALGRHKAAVLMLVREMRSQPVAGLAQTPALLRGMRWALRGAGLRADGLAGAVAERALACAWLATLRVWLGDDSADSGPTMAALDRNLRRLASVAPVLRSRSEQGRPGMAAGVEGAA
ncbi:MAG: helix-turn-helix domain-containing protein [Alphaproteobacteria bacterium]